MRAPGGAPLPMTIAVVPHLGPSTRLFLLPAGASAKRSAMDEQPLHQHANHMQITYIYIYSYLGYPREKRPNKTAIRAIWVRGHRETTAKSRTFNEVW